MTPSQLSNEDIIAAFREQLGREQVLSTLMDRTARAGDASIYRLVPRVVVQPRNVTDVQSILKYCADVGLYLTFRAAGTSLSGQAVTDGILVDVARHWRHHRILNGGSRIAIEPGVIGSHINAYLAPHRAKIGPDPASIGACMMGGIAANNASGMCCGVQFNSYHTMDSMKLVLADGLTLDTSAPDADDGLRTARPQLYRDLEIIRDTIRDDKPLAERIARKFSIKNTCGYSMNAFVDFDRPIDILSHLMIGSEGTLGFIAEITLRTIPDKPSKATTLVYFKELVDAGLAIKPLADAGAAVLEIMDRASMLSVAEEMKYAFSLDGAGNCAALLVEFQEDDETSLAKRLGVAQEILSRWPLLAPVSFTRDPAVQADYWHMRKGLFPSVGAMREMGTAVIIEDIAVEQSRLAECITDLQDLFRKHDFPDAIIFGHARDGNLHFVICNDFADQIQIARYARMMDELTALVVSKYDGSLKAEHGTGRNIAPFVESEWGEKLYSLMWRLKQLLDPGNVLNPGVILNRDPHAHLKNLKVMPIVSPIVDKCIECGFCEPRCPSRDLTITPRQRIAVLREIERLKTLGDLESRRTAGDLIAQYEYSGMDTCATDGMCATACPVKINTGEMIKELRENQHSPMAQGISVFLSRHFGALAAIAHFGLVMLKAGGPFGVSVARASAKLGHRMTGGTIPMLPEEMPIPRPAPRLPIPGIASPVRNKTVVYYPSCLTRTLGSLDGETSKVGVAEAAIAVLEKCGWNVIIPPGIGNTCCGQPFFSKGYACAGIDAACRTVETLWSTSDEGALPIICDTSPCSGQLHTSGAYLTGAHLAKWRQLAIFDFVEFMAGKVLADRVSWPRLQRSVTLHPTCTLMKMGGVPDLRKVASAFASDVTIPIQAECCGFAGDRGFNFPELTLSATRPEASEVAAESHCYSTCRTCEIGMTAATGQVYQSIIHLCYDALVASPPR